MSYHFPVLKNRQAISAMAMSLLLAACGGGDGTTSSSPSPTITGTAAVGAPLVGANISAKCKNGSSYTATAPTSGGGNYGIVVPSSAFPCAIRATGGSIGSGGPANSQNYHSFAQASGNANVTPLTDLIIAYASSTPPDTWFGGSPADLDLTALQTAVEDLIDTLVNDKGFTLPGGSFDPLTSTFTPENGDIYDDFLEALKNAIAASSIADYADLIDIIKDGNLGNLPDAPENTPPTGDDTQAATVHASLVKSYSLVFEGNCGTKCSFVDGQTYTATVGSDNSLIIASKTLTNPVNRKVSNAFNLVEIIWADGDLRYALSNNQSGVFNEINVGDAANPQGTGAPGFLGQLAEATAPASPADKLSALSGSYSPSYIEKVNHGPANMLDTDLGLTLGSTAGISVSSSGVVTIGSLVFNPASITFQESTGISGHFYTLKFTQESDEFTLRIYMSPVGIPVSWEIERKRTGVALTPRVWLESLPLPAPETDLLTDIKALGNVELVVVQDDTTYNSGRTLCEQLTLTVKGDGSALNPWSYDLSKAGQGVIASQKYRRSTGVYDSVGDARRIVFGTTSPTKLILHEDGSLDLEYPFLGTTRDRATSNATTISAVCPP